MDGQPRFCGQCGVSLVPLGGPHVSRGCEDCGSTKYLAEPGEGGVGVKVEKGDSFHIPAGWLTLSLDPKKSRGQFSKPGTVWFVTHMLTGDLPRESVDSLRQYLSTVEAQTDEVLFGSEKLAHLDLMNEGDAAKALRILEKDKLSAEWSAALVEVLRGQIVEALDEGADPDPILRALQLQAHRATLLYKQHLADYVWTGYEQSKAVYDLAAATAHTPAEAEKIRALEPAFGTLDEATLHAWVEANVNIAERLKVSGIDADVLRALAQYHLSLRERQRQDERWNAEHSVRLGEYKVKVWHFVLAAGGFGAVLGGTLARIV